MRRFGAVPFFRYKAIFKQELRGENLGAGSTYLLFVDLFCNTGLCLTKRKYANFVSDLCCYY